MPVHTQVKIAVGLRISLDLQFKNDTQGMKNMLTLSSMMEEHLEDGYFLIHMPIYEGYHYPLPRDDAILMKFFIDSEMYACKAMFSERVEQGGFLFAKMRRISRIKPHQRRDCYRLPCSMPVTVERLWKHEREIYPERQPTEGRMINVSDGGMLLATDENIQRGDKITLTFDLGGVEIIEGMALRAERIEDGKYLFRVAVQFRNTDKAQKRRLYKRIVDKQLEEIRRWKQDNKPLYVPAKECEAG